MVWVKKKFGHLKLNDITDPFKNSIDRPSEKGLDYITIDSAQGVIFLSSPNTSHWRYGLVNNTYVDTNNIQSSVSYNQQEQSLKLSVINYNPNNYSSETYSTIFNATPTLSYYMPEQWNYQLSSNYEAGGGTRFKIKTPDHDTVIFSFGCNNYEFLDMQPGLDLDNTFYNHPGKWVLSDLTIYFKNNKFYCSLNRECKISDSSTHSYNVLQESLVCQMSDSDETIGSWHEINLDITKRLLSLDQYQTSFLFLFFDNIKVLEVSDLYETGRYVDTEKNPYNLSDNSQIIYKETDTRTGEEIERANAFSSYSTCKPCIKYGSFPKNSLFTESLSNNITITNNVVNINFDIVDLSSKDMSSIIYAKDPLPAGPANITFTSTPGQSIEFKDIEVYGAQKLMVENSDLEGNIDIIQNTSSNSDLQGQINIVKSKDLNGQLVIKQPYEYELSLSITVPQPVIDLPGQLEIQYKTFKDINTYLTVPQPVIDLPGSMIIRKEYIEDLLNINVRVPVSVKPETYGPIDGDLIIKIPFPYTQFTDMEFILTETKTNLFIPQRYYERYDEYHLLLSKELDIKEDDEVRFTFCHNDGKSHVQKIEFYFKSMGNASYYFLNMITPYRVNIEDTNTKFLVFVNRKQIVNNKDYYIDNEEGVLVFLNDQLASSTNDRIDLVCFYTGIDDTAIADLPMSGYIYLKRNMIDRNYNNNMMATFINGQLIPRDKILRISNNIYKVKEDIETRHNLQILNMSNRINSLVPFYKQCKEYPFFSSTLLYNKDIVDNFNPRYTEYCFPVEISVPALTTYGRQHMTIYQNPVYFDPEFLLECKDYYISFIHTQTKSENLKYTLDFYPNDTSSSPEEMYVKLELHIKTPFEEELEESRTTVLFVTLPATINEINEEYCYASLKINQIINLDIWNNRFLEMCDGIILRIEPGKTYINEPSQVYFNLWSNGFEDSEKEQITIFEYRISDSYDGKGNIKYSKFLTFNPEESVKDIIRLANNNLK